MTPESFDALAGAFKEPLLLVSPSGVIQGLNRSAVTAIGATQKADLLQRELLETVSQSPESLRELMRLASRTSDQTFGTIKFNSQVQTHRVIANRVKNGQSYFVLLRLESQDVAIQQFASLNEKCEQLNRAIARRRAVEDQLRVERDVAAFGRDIGIALVQSHGLQEALQNCTTLMVEQMGAVFARIWLADDNAAELRLVASSGIYSHLDGDHSRIRFGEYKIGRIAETQQPHITNQVIGDVNVHDQAWAIREGMVAFIGYPLVVDGDTVGVMGLFSREVFSESVSDALASVANGIALRIRKQSIEDGLAKQTLALKEADRRKDEFLAMLSHELRNPLAPVRSGLDLLSLEDSQHRDTIEMMQQQVEHLVRLVDDLLDVSRIMRGKVELRKKPTQIAPLIEHAHETLRDAIQHAGHQLTMHIPAQPIWVNADAVRIVQVIENLLKNACKYTDPGGEISIAMEVQENILTITVRDNGIGIDGDLLPQVFNLFTQSDRTLDRSQGGLGIGLTLVKNLVEMHRGSVSAESDGLGLGCTFTVQLPTCAAPKPVVDERPRDAIVVPLRVLAVDDNRAARFLLAKLFGKLGPHQVVTADSGPAAIAMFAEFRPDLVLLDIGLPGMDGYEVARVLRQTETDHDFLLVALTGYGQKDDRLKSKAAGFDEHLVKPPSVSQLRGLLVHPKLAQPAESD